MAGNDLGEISVYLNDKDSLSLRYLMEYEHSIRSDEDNLTADQAKNAVISTAIGKFWDVLDNLELFSKYGSVVVIHSADGTERNFGWDRICDSEDYQKDNEPNAALGISQRDFILLEASLRRVSKFVAKGRFPERDEILRIALRFRAETIRFWNRKRKNESEEELGINTPRGLLPVF